MDADGEVAQTGHDAWETADVDFGVVLAEGAVVDVVQKVLDLLVPSDPGGELGAGRRAGRQAGDRVDAFDGELAGGEVISPVGDLEGLAGVWVVEWVKAAVFRRRLSVIRSVIAVSERAPARTLTVAAATNAGSG